MSTKREEAARRRVLANVADLGLNDNLLELETQGFTVLKQALTPDQVERAKRAILARVQTQTGYAVDPDKACADDYRGMHYQHYLIFEDPIFQEILLQKKPLALMYTSSVRAACCPQWVATSEARVACRLQCMRMAVLLV